MIGATDLRYERWLNGERGPNGLETFVRLEFGEANADWYLTHDRLNGHGIAVNAAARIARGAPLHRAVVSLVSLFLKPRKPAPESQPVECADSGA